jgi:serine/threonine protein kinase/Flp pilus assembly protein TadD
MSAFSQGMVIGRYRIDAPLGAGGMGVVYEATDEFLQRRVALKVLPPGRLTDDASRQRLLREARAAASLDHPNLCPVFDAGEHEGHLYIAMQYLEGETLASRLRKQHFTLNEALEIAGDVASALVEAHEHHIVHRDLKPGNIMLTPKGARVLDFGLAHILSGEQQPITRQGELSGTVPYMAPEQIRGEPTGRAVDVFSLGIVLYEMISGRRPFVGESAAAIMNAILYHPVPPIPTSDEDPANGVAQLLGWMLSKDSLRRPSASEVVNELRDLAGSLSSSTVVMPRREATDEIHPTEKVTTTSRRRRLETDAELVSRSIDPEARREFVKGRHLWNKRTPLAVREALEHFQAAVDIDPLFPEAFSGVADASMYLSFLDFVSPRIAMPKARSAATRALELDPSSDQAYATLAFIQTLYDWDWGRSDDSFQHAFRLNDGNAEAHHWYGIVTAVRGELDEARRHLSRAFDLNPLSPIIPVGLHFAEYYAGRFDEAVRICREITQSEPGFAPARFYLGRSLEVAGRLEEAVAAYRSFSDLVPVEMEHLPSLAACLAKLDRHEEADAIEARLRQAAATRYISAFYFALIASGRRERESTLEHLERAVDEHATRIYELHVDFRFGWLHDDAGFRALVERVGFCELRTVR